MTSSFLPLRPQLMDALTGESMDAPQVLRPVSFGAFQSEELYQVYHYNTVAFEALAKQTTQLLSDYGIYSKCMHMPLVYYWRGCYASTFSSRRHYVFIFYVRPSVDQLAIQPERFRGIFWRTYGGNGLKCCILMHPDQSSRMDFMPRLPNCTDKHQMPIILTNPMSDIWILRVTNQTCWRDFVKTAWPPSKLIRFCAWVVDFAILALFLLNYMCQILCLQLLSWQWMEGTNIIMVWRCLRR